MKKRTRNETISMPAGMHRIQITMSFPLRWVNSYILTEPDGKVSIVDPGPRTAETEQEWNDALAELGLTFQDIHQIVLTHHHPDHLGLSGWMQQMSGVPVLMSARSRQEAEYMWGPEASIDERLPEYYRIHGMPEYKTVEIKEHMRTFISQITPLPEVTLIADGETLRMGGKTWIAVETGDMPRDICRSMRLNRGKYCAGMPYCHRFRPISVCSRAVTRSHYSPTCKV